NEPIPTLEFGGLKTSHVQVDNVTTNFDLTLDITERDERFQIKFECNADLFEPQTISRMMGHFEMLLSGIADNPSQRISQLPLLTESERKQVLVEWVDTKTLYPANQCIAQLFEGQVAANPNSIAVTCEQGQLTYAELNTRANRLAHYLRERDVGPDTLVGLCLERSVDLIIALLGILKAGGAYVPLDPDYPIARLQLMIEDADVHLLLTQRS